MRTRQGIAAGPTLLSVLIPHQIIRPEGTTENSPAFQRWVLRHAEASPEGTAEPGSRNDWLLWQLADSAFPSGGFAHSSGLEAALQQGELRSPDELHDFIDSSLCQFGQASVPFMTGAYSHPEVLAELDRRCDCFTSNHVANRASRLQGQALLASAERIFAKPGLESLKRAGTEQLPNGHLAPVFGVVLRELGVEQADAVRLFLFWHLRGLVSAAVRLGLVGPLRAQALQRLLAARVEQVSQRCRAISIDDVAQTAPLLDLWQANQDRLYSRLFQS